MKREISRMLNPRSVAVIGGGQWCEQVVAQSRRIRFAGEVWPVHPRGGEIAGLKACTDLQSLPGIPDAVFIGINRHATIDAVATLQQLGAGGAICFASGFTEAMAEDDSGSDLQNRLVKAAGDMPILGPNCYGFINALDRVAIWPDQHGMGPVDRGVAILTQSSNIAINLTMQQRALPIAHMIACGNMAQTSQAEIACALLDDDRVSVIGLHVEGFADLRQWETMAEKAHRRGVPLVALKTGASQQAQLASISHTASLAGSDAGAQAFLDRLGIARLNSLPEFLETMKLLHCAGPLQSSAIASISCSGGEASLIADMAKARGLELPALGESRANRLKTALGPLVALANPLDYHTYIWRDAGAMARAWAAMTGDGFAMTFSIVDYPLTDAADWSCATQAALDVRRTTGAPFAVVSTLPELMPPLIARELMDGGVVPLAGLNEALAAVRAAAFVHPPAADPVLLPGHPPAGRLLSEAEAKAALVGHGLIVPVSRLALNANDAGRRAGELNEPLVLKAVGLAHKSDLGAVRLDLSADQVAGAAREIGGNTFLVEEMVEGGVAELLIGVVRDPAHGFVLTLAAGGVLTELMQDCVSLLLPSTREQVQQALTGLKCARLLDGYRGKPAADMAAILDAVAAVQAYVLANAHSVVEIEINPLVCTPDGAVAVDALIRKANE